MTRACAEVVVAELVGISVVLSEVPTTESAVVDAVAEVVVTAGDEHEATKTENDTRAVVNLARSTHRVLTERT